MTWRITDQIEGLSYEEAREEFEWELPNDFNLAFDLLRKHEDPRARVALLMGYSDGTRETLTFHDLDVRSNQLARALADLGVGRGDRVALMIPQKPAAPITHLACWKLGAISLPLTVLFGADATRYRLRDSGAKAVVVDASERDTIDAVRDDCPDLKHVIEVDGPAGEGQTDDGHRFVDLLAAQPRTYDIVDTDPETPAMILYTSGTTGPPKGVLHTHGLGPGMCPGMYMLNELDVVGDHVMWTHADWAWITGPSHMITAWHHGRPLVGYPMDEFDPELAFEILEEFGVTKAFAAPTACRMMMNVEAPSDRYDLVLEGLISGGEAVTPEIREWVDEEFGIVVNEVYGQTEATPIVGTCHSWGVTKQGSMGKPMPGHTVEIIDPETGQRCPTNEMGEIAIQRSDDPLVFEEYWNKPDKTDAVTLDNWHLTGDLARRDEGGYLWYETRADDVIITSGYRVGPSEVESVVLDHPDIEQAGVIGVPDDTRGEVIKAFVQPTPDATRSDALRDEIRDLVRERLAKYEYPREIEFMDELPMTTTGKIRRVDLREREGIE